MGVMLQAFYWDCPRAENREHEWWSLIKSSDLAARDVLIWDPPTESVTFVENHDVVRDSPIINDKLLAYAFILTHEGYPCVFWQDYFNWDFAQHGNQSGIDALIKVHEQNAAGPTQVLFANDDLYIMQRLGAATKPDSPLFSTTAAVGTEHGYKRDGIIRA